MIYIYKKEIQEIIFFLLIFTKVNVSQNEFNLFMDKYDLSDILESVEIIRSLK